MTHASQQLSRNNQASRSRTPSAASAKPPIVLTIAGFDPSNGAGITADLQVFAAHGLFGTSAITALTVQSTVGVAAVDPANPATLRQTLRHLTADLPPVGIKIGMLATDALVAEVADFLSHLTRELSVPQMPIVLDPVIISSSGTMLLNPSGLSALQDHLLTQVTWITPNWQELALLTGTKIATLDDAKASLGLFTRRHPHLYIVATGGDSETPTDLLYTPTGELHTFIGRHIETSSTHGTGCAFSSALLSRLILGDPPAKAVAAAKSYVEGALRQAAPGLGSGRGPLNLLWPFETA